MTTQFLIADDHPIFVKGITDIIKEVGLGDVVGNVSNGKELLQKLNSHVANFIILDINMPEMNGLVAAERIRKLYPKLPILVVSMNDDFGTIESLRKIGVNGFIPKSFDSNDLEDAITCILRDEYFFPKSSFDVFSDSKQLSSRELEIVRWVLDGKSSKEIAELLCISIFTVDTHRKNIGRKTGAKTVLQLSKLMSNSNP